MRHLVMQQKKLLYKTLIFLALLCAGSVRLLHADEPNDRYFQMREEEIRTKQARADDLNYRIQTAQQQMERERQQIQDANEKIWKEFNQNLEVERKELKGKIETIDQRQALFENELERKRQQDQLRLREKEDEIKRMMLDIDRLRKELDQDRTTFERARKDYESRQVEARQPSKQAGSGEAQGEILSDGSVRWAESRKGSAQTADVWNVQDNQSEYFISNGDVLMIEVWRNPDLTKRVIVRPDGRISLPLAGDLQAAGISLVQLRDQITEKFSVYIRDPQVTISLEGFGSGRKFIILGEIRSPGVYRFQDSITLIEALALAGGFTEKSHRGKVMIIRGDIKKDPQVKIIGANPANILNRGMLTENLVIQPNDIIYLGKDFLGDYREFINEVVQPAMSTTLDAFVLRSAIRTMQDRRN